MGVFQLTAFALIAASMAILVRAHRPEMALLISIVAGLILLVYIVLQASGIIDTLSDLVTRYNIELSYIGVLVKVIGIAYIVQFASEICKDAGEQTLSSKVELGGRVMILAAALPAAVSLLDMAAALLPNASP